MISGSKRMNFALPPERQRAVSGWVYRYAIRDGTAVILGRESLTLVRNPSWDPRSDQLRKAYPDRIEVEMRGTLNSERRRNAGRIDRGALDVVLDDSAPSAQIRRYQRSPGLRRRLHLNAYSGVEYITMNLAVPPFDDVHARRALNLTLDRTALARIESGPRGFGPVTPTEHDLPNSIERDLLADYAPFPLRGDIAAAKAEMARSRYDHNHDGRCDVPACSSVVAYGVADEIQTLRGTDALVRRDFARLGVDPGDPACPPCRRRSDHRPTPDAGGAYAPHRLARRLPRRRRLRSSAPKADQRRERRPLVARCNTRTASPLGLPETIGAERRSEDFAVSRAP